MLSARARAAAAMTDCDLLTGWAGDAGFAGVARVLAHDAAMTNAAKRTLFRTYLPPFRVRPYIVLSGLQHGV